MMAFIQSKKSAVVLLYVLLTSLVNANRKEDAPPESPEEGSKQKSQLLGHLESIGKSGDMSPIDSSIGYISPKEFLNNYVLQNRPLLLKGAGKLSPAFSLWNDAYLRSKTPDGEEGDITAEIGKKETRSNGTKSLNFKAFLDSYNTSDIYMVNGVPEYLKADIVVPWSLQCEDYKKGITDFVFWFSSGSTKSVLHHDSYENINCLYRGTKRLVMINTTRYIDIEPKIIDIQNGAYSSMDVERVDLEKYPFMSGIHFHEAVMEPGDCLYIPYKWMHHVASVGSNLAVNIWWDKLINTRINLSKCATEFDETLTLKKLNVKTTTTKTTSEEETSNIYADIVNNLKFLIFSPHHEDVKLSQFVKALLGDFSNEMELNAMAVEILKLVYIKRVGHLIKEQDLDKISRNKMENLHYYAQEFDKISNIIGKETRIAEGILPGAREFVAEVSDEGNDQEEQLPRVDKNVKEDLSNKPHTEL